MSNNSCVNTSIFNELNIHFTNTQIETLNEIKILYGNAKFYYSTNEFSGALVSYSCAAVLLNSMIRELKSKDADGGEHASSPRTSVESHSENDSSSTIVKSQGRRRSYSIGGANDTSGLEHALNCCLTAVEILQKKVGSSRADGEKDEKKDWEKICTKLKPLVFSKGSSNCIFFSMVAGMKREKQIFKSTLVYPLMYPRLYPSASRGILLYGPPGTGKTFIVKAAVNELQKTDPNIGILFFTPSPGDLKGKYVGQTEKKIEEWFTCASKAACESQLTCSKDGIKRFISVIFMDEFDAIAPDRNTDKTGLAANSVNTLLQMMDGIDSKKNITVIAATNFPWYLDAAILRRFDTQILVDLPNEGDILELLNMEMRKIIKFKENKPQNAYCESEMKKYKKNNEIAVETKTNVICDNECLDEPPTDLTVTIPYNQMRYDFYDDIELTENRLGTVKEIFKDEKGNILSCDISFNDVVERVPYQEIKNPSLIREVKPQQEVQVISRSGGFVDGLVQKLHADKFSNSDISRLIKAANTYTGQICVEGNLFYSTKEFFKDYRNEELFISCVTKLRRQRFMVEVSVKLLQWYLKDTDENITPGIYQLNKPDIVSITYKEKVYINSKCFLYKHTEFAIEDPAIKDIFIECGKEFSNIKDVNLTDNDEMNKYVTLYQNSIINKKSYSVILTFDFSIKQTETDFDENALYPISRNLIDSVFVPINNEFQNIQQYIADFEKAETDTKKSGIKPGEDVKKVGIDTKETVTLINGKLSLNLTEDDITSIKTNVMFNIINDDNKVVETKDFFTDGLRKILTPKFDSIINKSNFNLINNNYLLYCILLCLHGIEKLDIEPKSELDESKGESDKSKGGSDKSKTSLLNDTMNLYLDSFDYSSFQFIKKKDDGIDNKIPLPIKYGEDENFSVYYNIDKKTITLSVMDFISIIVMDNYDLLDKILRTLGKIINSTVLKSVADKLELRKKGGSSDDLLSDVLDKLTSDYRVMISLDFFVTLCNKNINIKEINDSLCRNFLHHAEYFIKCDNHTAKPFEIKNTFTQDTQLLMQLYFNDIVYFYEMTKYQTASDVYLNRYITSLFPKEISADADDDVITTDMYYMQLICKRILDNYIYVKSNGKTVITSTTESVKKGTIIGENTTEIVDTGAKEVEKVVEDKVVEDEEGKVVKDEVVEDEAVVEGPKKGGAKKRKSLIRGSDSKKKKQNNTLRHKLQKKNRSNKINSHSSKIRDKKYIKIHYGGAPDNTQANELFISFCMGNVPDTHSKKIVEKRIFVKTEYDIDELKTQHKSGWLNYFYYEGGGGVKSAWNFITKSLEDRNAQNNKTKMEIIEGLKKKNQYLALIFKRVAAVGFLITQNNNNVEDDNDILPKSKSTKSDGAKKNVVINWVELDPSSYAWTMFKEFFFGGVAVGWRAWEVIGAVPAVVANDVPGAALDAALDAAPGAAPELAPMGPDPMPHGWMPDAAQGAALDAAPGLLPPGAENLPPPGPWDAFMAFCGWAWSTTRALIGYGYTGVKGVFKNSFGGLLVAAFAMYEGHQFITAENVDQNAVVNNTLLSIIMNIIIDQRYIVTKTFNEEPAQLFKEFLEKKISQTIGIIQRAVKFVASSSTLKKETNNTEIILYNKNAQNEPSDIKDKLTNLNVPIRAFAYALQTVKSTYVKETGELLQQYYDNKDKFMENWKKKQREKGQA